MDDVAVCDVSNSIEANLDMDSNTEYIILLAHALIATLSNIAFVSYSLGDNRKQKSATLITG